MSHHDLRNEYEPGTHVVAGLNRRDLGVYVGYEGGLGCVGDDRPHVVAVLVGYETEENLGWEIRRYNYVELDLNA